MAEEPPFSEESDAPVDNDDAVASDDLEEEEDEEDDEEDEGEDEEEDYDEEEEEDQHKKKKTRPSPKRARPATSLHKSRKSSKRSKTSARNFMDIEAAVGDDDEEDEDYEDDTDFLREAGEAQLAERELDFSHRRRLNHTFQGLGPPETRGAVGHLASAIGSLERRYQKYDEEGNEGEGDDDEGGYMDYGDDEEVRGDDPSRFLPDSQDAKLWVVATNRGTPERDIVVSIMNKFMHMQQKGTPLPILSAFAADGIRGRIYIEAENPGQIAEALVGLRSVNLTNIKMVPLKEMGIVYTMGSKNVKPVVRGQLVRLRGGLYGGDLGQVTDYDEQTGSAWVRIVPRLDIDDAIAKQKNKASPGSTTIKEKSVLRRPIPRMFNREEIEVKGGDVEPGLVRGTFRFDGKVFEEAGYLLRKVRSRTLIVGDDVAPTVAELKDFTKSVEGTEEGSGTASWVTLLAGQPFGVRTASYSVGDSIVLQTGDLTGLKARVVSVEGKTLTVLPEGLGKKITVSTSEVVKYFEVGDSVKVVAGPHAGKSGLITSLDLEKGLATVFWPELSRPFSCSLDSLQLCPNSGIGTGGISSLKGFTVGDLIQLSSQETAIILRIDPGRSFTVLTTENKVDTVPLSRLASKRNNDFGLAIDADGHQFGIKAMVTLKDPSFKNQTGRIQHIWKEYVFVKFSNKDTATHMGGYRVCRSHDVRVMNADGTTFIPATTTALSQHGGVGRPDSSHRGGGFHNVGRGGRGGRGRFTGSRVKLIGTRHKGKYGKIIGFDANDNFRIQLDSNQTTVVSKNDVLMLDTPRGGYRGGSRGGGGGRGGGREWNNYFNSVRESKTKGNSEGATSLWWNETKDDTSNPPSTGGW